MKNSLLDQGFLDYLSVYRERLTPLLNDPLRQYMGDSRRHVGEAIRFRRRVRRLVTGVVGSIILAFLVVALWQWSEAINEREKVAEQDEHARALLLQMTAILAAKEMESLTKRALVEIADGLAQMVDQRGLVQAPAAFELVRIKNDGGRVVGMESLTRTGA